VETLSSDIISRALTTRRLGRPSLFYPCVASTNDLVHEQARAGAAEGLLVVADEQTAGRGRQGRAWWSPPGGLWFSLLLRPLIPLERAGQLTMCLGLGAVEGIEQATGLRAGLKWPNDIVYAGRKLGGMLAELGISGQRLEYAVLGLGLNVNVSFDWPVAPTRLAGSATSLQIALGHPVDRLPLLAAIMARCEGWYERLLAGQSLHRAWADRLETLGQKVAAMLPEECIEGLAVGITPEGGLLLRTEEGILRTIWAGDVVSISHAAGPD